MIRDYLFIVFRSFSRRKLRGWLTIVGIFIGITAVVSLISLSQGMQDAIVMQFESLGTNRIVITAGGVSLGPIGSELTTARLGEEDVKAIQSIPGVDSVVPVLIQTARVDYNDETEYITIFCVPTDSETSKTINSFRFLHVESGKAAETGYEVDVGKKIADELFEKKVSIGSKIKIDGKSFKVTGIRKKAGTGIHDNILKIPIDTARDIFDEPEKISLIFAVTKTESNTSQIAEAIKKKLRKERNVEEGEEDFTVQTAEQSIGIFKEILAIVQIILVGIAAISLLVGGVGIMNTMFTSVLERTREIGIMKAIGAKSKQIMVLFLIESGMVGLVGGVIGIILGIGIAKIAQIIATYNGIDLYPAISIPLILFALAFSFIIGVIAGTLPAIRASRLRPIESIRRH